MSDPERNANIGPENAPTGIVVQLPKDLDGFYENIRDINRNPEMPIKIGEAQIHDSLFESVSTQITPTRISHIDKDYVYVHDRQIQIGTHTWYSNGFTLESNLKTPASGKIYFSDDEISSIRDILAEKHSTKIICELKEYAGRFIRIVSKYDEDKEEGLAIYLGHPNQETQQDKLKKNIAKNMSYLSLRERNLELQRREEQLAYTQLSIFTISNHCDLNDYEKHLKGSSWNVGNEIHFKEIVRFYCDAYQDILNTIYEVKGIKKPDIKIMLLSPFDMCNTTNHLSRNNFEMIKGQDKAVVEAKKLVHAIKNPEIYKKRGVKIPKGILFHGPPGTGKTMIAEAIANEVGATFFEVHGTDIHTKWYGESEKNMQAVFDKANKAASGYKKAIIFFDEFDALTPHRDEAYEATQRVIAVILENMSGTKANPNVTIIAATNRPEAIDSAVKRPGRFDKIIEVPLPDTEGRISILKSYIEKAMKNSSEPDILFDQDINFEEISSFANGMSGADLVTVINQALEEKLDKELNGEPWKPVNTDEIIDIVNKIILSRTDKIEVKFDKK